MLVLICGRFMQAKSDLILALLPERNLKGCLLSAAPIYLLQEENPSDSHKCQTKTTHILTNIEGMCNAYQLQCLMQLLSAAQFVNTELMIPIRTCIGAV